MQSCIIPKGVCDDIDKLCRRFIWGEESDERKFHSISWERICQPKKEGGLGLRTMRDLNTTFMMKAAWNLCSTPSILWKQVLRTKYNTGYADFPSINRKKPGSNFWRGIRNNWDLFRSNLMWQLGDGETARFWEDHWYFQEVPLINLTIQPLDNNLSQRRVSDFLNAAGNWDRNTLDHFLPTDVVQKVLSITPPNIRNGNDTCVWRNSADGAFTTKSAYLSIKKQNSNVSSSNFDLVWIWPGPERIRIFLWKATHAILMTNAERARRHISPCNLCPICGGYEETLLHAFRDCNRIQLLWSCIVIPNNYSFFRFDNWNRWLSSNLARNHSYQDQNWRMIFAFTLDSIWRARNDWVFDGSSISFHGILSRAQAQLQGSVINKLTVKALDPLCRNSIPATQIWWPSTIENSVVISVDASLTEYGFKAGCGGAFRNIAGDFLCGFSMKLPQCTVLEAELRAIWKGLEIAKDKGWDKVYMLSDSQSAINLLSGGATAPNSFSPIINSIGELTNEGLIVSWSKIPRDHNKVADALAKFSLSISCNCLIFDSAPVFLHPLLRMDKDGLANL